MVVVTGLCGVALVAVGGLAQAVGPGRWTAPSSGGGRSVRDPAAPPDAVFLLGAAGPHGAREASGSSSALEPCVFVTSADNKVAIQNSGPCSISLQSTGGAWHKYTLSRDLPPEALPNNASEERARKAGKHVPQSGDHSPGKDAAEATKAVAEEDTQSSLTDNSSRKKTEATGQDDDTRHNGTSTDKVSAGRRRKSPRAEGSRDGRKKGPPPRSSHGKGAGSNGSSAEGGAEAAATGDCGAAEDSACCSVFGCGDAYDVAQLCQCNSQCGDFSNCCPDYQAVCATSLPKKASPGHRAETTTEKPPPQTTPARQAGFPSLLCFSVIRSEGNEINLVGAQLDRHASIFACDRTLVFSNGPSIRIGTMDAMDSVSIPTDSIGIGNLANEGETTNSWLNTVIFMKVWHWLVKDGQWKSYDWTVKVDPDAVFFPERLRDHVKPYTPPGGGNYYMVNCNKVYAADPADEVLKEKLFGALEVFSNQAVLAYADGHKRCSNELEWHGWGEDYYMQSCLSLLGVLPVGDFNMVGDKRCFEAPCSDTGKVAFHDFKDVPAYFNCWEESLGPAGVQGYAERTV